MAIFEKPSQTKSVVDDTEKLICTVENAQNNNKHTEYILRVQRGPSKENTWHVSRRYRDFAALHSSLQQANIDLPLPPKKLIGNMQPSFIAERQIALQNYIDEVLKREVLALTLQVRSFLDPSNYSLAIAEQALQSVSIALRGDGRYELKGPLNGIGWRPRKHYFLVTDIENRSNCILSWQTYGPDRALNDKDLQTAFKSLQSISHPYIDDILAIHNLETGAYVVRKIHETGSLRDILYGTDYSKNYLAKYGNPKVRKPFTIGQIAHYGYQILQALKFLHEKGLPHGHLHPGNIAIDNQKAMLMDIENGLIGASCFYRSHLRQRRRACSAEAVDVHCFALTLYEMAFGEPLTEPYKDTYPAGTDEGLESVLRLCLSRSASKYGALSVEELLCQPLFARAPLNGFLASDHDRAHLKFPLALKDEIRKAVEQVEDRLKTEQKLDEIRKAVEQVEDRLKTEQKLDRSTKREVRIQEILNSEEEMKKQKRRAKKRDSVWKSTSSLAETVRSHSASTASSPTPPALSAEPQNNGHSSAATSPSASNGRSALLEAICGFDKSRLARAPR